MGPVSACLFVKGLTLSRINFQLRKCLYRVTESNGPIGLFV